MKYAFILGLLPVAAFAEEPFMQAECSVSAGCYCREIAKDDPKMLAAIAPVTDVAPHISFVIESSGMSYLAMEPVDIIHQAHGGQGECPLMGVPTPHVPRDGLWGYSARPVETEGECLQDVAPLIDAELAAMATEHRIAWEGAFHPDKLLISDAAEPVGWEQIGPTNFIAEKGTAPGMPTQIAVHFQSFLTTPETAIATAVLDMHGDPVLETLGMANCKITATLDFKWLSD